MILRIYRRYKRDSGNGWTWVEELTTDIVVQDYAQAVEAMGRADQQNAAGGAMCGWLYSLWNT